MIYPLRPNNGMHPARFSVLLIVSSCGLAVVCGRVRDMIFMFEQKNKLVETEVEIDSFNLSVISCFVIRGQRMLLRTTVMFLQERDHEGKSERASFVRHRDNTWRNNHSTSPR